MNNKVSKILFHPIVRIVLSIIAIISTTGLIKEFLTKPLFLAIDPTEELGRIIVPLLSTFLMVGVYYLLTKYYEKSPFTDFAKKQALGETVSGFLLGFLVISAVVMVLYLGGFYEINGSNSVRSFLPTLSFLIGAAMLEEIVFRGIVYKVLEKWKGTTIALISSAIIFQLPHFMNPHEAFLPAALGVLFGLLHALMYVDTQRLWLPFAFHAGWNLAQPFFGTTLSGIDGFDAFFESTMQGHELITGSAFGVEDSLLSMLVLVILTTVFYLRIKKKGLWVRNPGLVNT